MSNDIDERVVEMKFDNASFQKNLQTSQASLNELDKTIKGVDGKSIGNLGAAADGVGSRFSAMAVVGVTALATLVNRAIVAGGQMLKSLAVDPISEGWSDYQKKLTSVQTVMNATGASIEKVSGYFDQLDEYADKTIYNLSDMTSAFAKFTNAGVKMNVSVPAIKGIANAVALAGQDAGAAQIAFYNLSQSIAGGFLTTTDYKSLNLANVATKELKDYIVDTAVAMGTLKKVGKDAYDIVAKKGKDAFKVAELFNGQLSEGWATSKVLLKTFGDFGDITTDIGKKALAAAQNVKSLPMMLETLKAAVGTTWTDTFEIIFGNVTESTKLFTGLTIQIQTIFDMFNNGRNDILKGWADKGGRKALFAGVTNILTAITKAIEIIQDAWRSIFPNRRTYDTLVDLTQAFENFTKKLIPTEKTIDALKNTFKGIFAILNIVWTVAKTVLKGLWTLLKPVLSVLGLAGDGLLDMSSKFGKWAEGLNEAFQNSKFIPVVTEWFEKMGKVVAKYVGAAVIWIKLGADKIREFIDGFKNADNADKFGDKLSSLNEAGIKFGIWLRKQKKLLDKFMGWFTNFRGQFVTQIQKMITKIDLLGENKSGENFFDRLKKGMSGLKDAGPDIIEAFKQIGSFFAGVWDIIKKVGEGIGKTVKFIVDQFKRLISGVDPNVAAGTLNLGLFAIGASALKNILGPGIQLLKSFEGLMNSFKAEIWSKAMLNVAIALLALAGAMFIMSKVPADKFGDVATVLGVMMVALVGVMKQLKALATGEGALSAKTALGLSVVLLIIGGALLLFASAANVFASAGWGGFGIGMLSLAGMVGVLWTLQKAKLGGKNMIKVATSMVIIGSAMLVFALGIKALSLLNFQEVATGLGITASALILFGYAMSSLPIKKAVASAQAFLIISAAMIVLAAAMKIIASMSWEELAKGLGVLAVSLAAIFGFMKLFKGEAASAAAFLLIVSSLALLTEVLKAIGQLPISAIVTGLVTIAVALGLVVAACIALTETGAFVALYGLAAVLASIGIAAAGVGAGIYLTVAAFEKLIEIGKQGAPVIIQSLTNLAQSMPAFANLIVQFFLNLLRQIAENIDKILEMVVSIALSVLNSLGPIIEKLIDVVIDALEALARRIWQFFRDNAYIWAETGATVIAEFIQGIADNIGDIVDAAADLIVNFIHGIEDNIGDIIDAAADLITTFIDHLGDDTVAIADAATDFIVQLMDAFGDNSLEIITAAGDTLQEFLDGLNDWVDDHMQDLIDAGAELAGHVAEGFGQGIAQVNPLTMGWNFGKGFINGVENIFQMHSPSKVMKALGVFVMQGFAQGLKSGNSEYVQDAWNDMRENLNNFITDTNSKIKQAKTKLAQLKKNPRKNAKAIKEETAAIKKLTAERDKAAATYKYMGKYLVDERNKLKKLADQYTIVTQKLEDAQQALADAKQERLDYQASTKDSFDDFMDVDTETKLSDFIDNMRKQLDATQQLRNDLAAVNAMGLNDKLYRQLLEQGTDSIPFLEQIIAGGQDAVDELNNISRDLDTVSEGLGTDASSNLYDAGVNMAQGIVDGLQSQADALKKQMESLADVMVNAIKKKLGIKSPAREGMEIGDFMAQGVVKGLNQASVSVANAAENMGGMMAEGLEKSLKYVNEMVPDSLDMNPTITPVLDLSQVESQSGKLNSMFDTKKLAVDASTAKAAVVASQVKANMDASTSTDGTNEPSLIQFNQYNNSPKALSDVEIYRQTNNQLSKAKGALTT